MITSIDPFMTSSPKKIIEKAQIYSKTLQNFHQLPSSANKQSSVQRHAQNHKRHVQLTVQKSQYQQDLYRWKEKQDSNMRQTFQQKIKHRQSTNDKNQVEIDKKRAKDRQTYEKHLKEVYVRYCQEQKKHRDNEKEGALKLRKELMEFYQKQANKKRLSEHRQVSVGSCYESAVDRINHIHHKNEQFSQKTEQSLASSLVRNNHYESVIGKKKLSLSNSNKKKMITYRHSIDLYNNRELKFVQKCANNEQGSLQAWKHQDEDNNKTKKRIGQFFKKRLEKWSQQKQRIDQKRAQLPQKCNLKLDKTTKASFRQTASSFRSTAKEWFSIVERNKASIRQFDEMRKDDIMNIHLDLRLKNDSISKISERMKSLRHQAKKTADDFL